VPIGSKLPKNKEVWTDSPCLIIDYKHIKDLVT